MQKSDNRLPRWLPSWGFVCKIVWKWSRNLLDFSFLYQWKGRCSSYACLHSTRIWCFISMWNSAQWIPWVGINTQIWQSMIWAGKIGRRTQQVLSRYGLWILMRLLPCDQCNIWSQALFCLIFTEFSHCTTELEDKSVRSIWSVLTFLQTCVNGLALLQRHCHQVILDFFVLWLLVSNHDCTSKCTTLLGLKWNQS